MTLALLYWILMLAWLVFGLWTNWAAMRTDWRPAGGQLIVFLLFLVVGWGVFGAPIRG